MFLLAQWSHCRQVSTTKPVIAFLFYLAIQLSTCMLKWSTFIQWRMHFNTSSHELHWSETPGRECSMEYGLWSQLLTSFTVATDKLSKTRSAHSQRRESLNDFSEHDIQVAHQPPNTYKASPITMPLPSLAIKIIFDNNAMGFCSNFYPEIVRSGAQFEKAALRNANSLFITSDQRSVHLLHTYLLKISFFHWLRWCVCA